MFLKEPLNNIIIYKSNINDISNNEKVFKILRNNYHDFDNWLMKMKTNNIDVYYTKNDNTISSILILKLNELDKEQFKENGNILKIRTFLVLDKNRGIGTKYLKLINDIATTNNIDYIYMTIKIKNKELINFMQKNGFQKYGQYHDEYVYYKELV